MKTIVQSCLTDCYNDLPQPEFVLSPEDSELNYFLWMPGFKYQPSFQEKLTKLRSLSTKSDSTVQEALEELVFITHPLSTSYSPITHTIIHLFTVRRQNLS